MAQPCSCRFTTTATPVSWRVLKLVGLGEPLGIALVQTTLLYVGVLVTALAIGRSTHSSAVLASVWLGAVALLPAAAWTGLVFSEGLAAPVLFLVLALTIIAVFRVSDRATSRTAWAVVIAWGLACGLAWMVRPGLIWVPAAMGMVLVVLCAYLAVTGQRRALLLPVGFAVAVMLVAMPQFQYEDPLKTEFAEVNRRLAPLTFRWATDMTETGPAGIVFSPIPANPELDRVTTIKRALGSRQWQATALVAHLVSGWDARPSPSYVYADTGNRWLIVSGLSGFLLVGVLCVALMIWQRRPYWMRPDTYTLGALLFVFALSQAVLAVSAAEFRFNLAGWLIAGCCLAMISALGWWTRRRAAIAVVVGLILSGVVVLIGQFTLMYSEWWLEYSRMIG